MPNHVTTELVMSPLIAFAFTEERDGERVVDFNTVIPCPPDDDPMFTAARTDYGNGMVGYSVDGYSPMDWNRNHWGTKWNAYESSVEALPGDLCRVRFETAWAHPFPVIEKLSLLVAPTDLICVRYADEDLGHNLGEYSIQNGRIVSQTEFTQGSDEANEFAAQLVYGQTYAEIYGEDAV